MFPFYKAWDFDYPLIPLIPDARERFYVLFVIRLGKAVLSSLLLFVCLNESSFTLFYVKIGLF